MPPRKNLPAVVEAEATEPAEAESRPVDFYGRQVLVLRPTAEQIAVWQRVAKRQAALNGDKMTNEDAMALLDRAMRIVETILADKADRDWLEDQMLDGVLRLDQVVSIVGLTADAYSDTAGAAPTNGPQPKARRR